MGKHEPMNDWTTTFRSQPHSLCVFHAHTLSLSYPHLKDIHVDQEDPPKKNNWRPLLVVSLNPCEQFQLTRDSGGTEGASSSSTTQEPSAPPKSAHPMPFGVVVAVDQMSMYSWTHLCFKWWESCISMSVSTPWAYGVCSHHLAQSTPAHVETSGCTIRSS